MDGYCEWMLFAQALLLQQRAVPVSCTRRLGFFERLVTIRC